LEGRDLIGMARTGSGDGVVRFEFSRDQVQEIENTLCKGKF